MIIPAILMFIWKRGSFLKDRSTYRPEIACLSRRSRGYSLIKSARSDYALGFVGQVCGKKTHFWSETIPAKTKKIPAIVKDSHSPILSLASRVLARNRGMCRSRNQPNTMIPESSAAHFLVGGSRRPRPPANKQTPQK